MVALAELHKLFDDWYQHHPIPDPYTWHLERCTVGGTHGSRYAILLIYRDEHGVRGVVHRTEYLSGKEMSKVLEAGIVIARGMARAKEAEVEKDDDRLSLKEMLVENDDFWVNAFQAEVRVTVIYEAALGAIIRCGGALKGDELVPLLVRLAREALEEAAASRK